MLNSEKLMSSIEKTQGQKRKADNLFPNFLFMGRVSFTDLEHVRCLCQIVLDCLHGVSSQCQWFSASKVFEAPIAALFSEAGDPFVHNFHDLCLCQSQQGFRGPMTIYCIHYVVQNQSKVLQLVCKPRKLFTSS